jgi:ribonuclease D
VSDSTQTQDAAEPVVQELPLLAVPADGVPEPVTTSLALSQLVEAMKSASGPVAVDAERASGYRYSQRAYLVQLRREGVGTALIDPIELPALAGLNAVIGDTSPQPPEWILHAANQDLPCLGEIGLRPGRLFDTELAGRMLGVERVALGTMVEHHLGVRLEKGHSAADWSTRPLPHDWLAYAALDVELLVQLRDVLAGLLQDAGKLDWAYQEFEAERLAPPPVPRADPWRRISGIHKLRGRLQLGVARALWFTRDEFAASRDVAPGRVLPDSAIIEAARTLPKRAEDLGTLPIFSGPRQKRQLGRWFGAIEQARALPDSELPPVTGPATDPVPPAARWRDRDPVAADRLARCRDVVNSLADEHSVLAQNLLPSDILRKLAWEPPSVADVVAVSEALSASGARPWQVELAASALAQALAG